MFSSLATGEIRLLHILPGHLKDEIVCFLEITTLESAYQALSYTWGGQDLACEIILSGQPYPVTSNLYDAIKHLRYDNGRERILWIDAICIDQQNNEERNAQVNMMAQIYRNARLVVMWLGKETYIDDISIEGIAFALLEQTQEVFRQYGLVDLDFQQLDPSGSTCPGYGLPNTSSTKWIALARLFSKPYFERIWIIQEVVMASKAILACGRLSIEWDAIRCFAKSVQKGGALGNLEYDAIAPGIVSVNVMADLKDRQFSGGIELLPLLVRTRLYQATKDVDKVFALMNLSSNSHNVGIKVDYSLEGEPHKLWHKLALHSLTEHQNLLCLSNASVNTSFQQSWVPNWADKFDGRICLALQGEQHFRASGIMEASIKVSDDCQVITVAGYIVDAVDKIAPEMNTFVPNALKAGPLDVWMTKEESDERTSIFAAAICDPLEISKHAFKYSKVSRNSELARTLCCDLLMTGEKANIENASRILEWMITIMSRFASGDVPEDPGELEALKQKLEAMRPVDLRLEEIMHPFISFGVGRSVCSTTKGDLGRVPFGTRPGDLVCILTGGTVPFVLRADGSEYRLVGECFINSIMYGEALKTADLNLHEFSIR